jgi:hypothetical protein
VSATAEDAPADLDALRDTFLRLLTVDSETKDRRKREYNQAIFDKDEGWAVFSGTDLGMVMDKFDRAVKEVRCG